VLYTCPMQLPILTTKLYIPPVKPNLVQRSRLVERLNECLETGCKLALISAPAGFGKTTLVSEWAALSGHPVAWISLDEGDADPTIFLSYLVLAIQSIEPGIGNEIIAALQSTQPPPIESILTSLANAIAGFSKPFILVLDDYHAVDSKPVDEALAFLLQHLPTSMHLLVTTREDPGLPLARLRAQGQLVELRAADLRFTSAEAAEFLNHIMALALSEADLALLEARSEGWIAGLQLAALSMQGRDDIPAFIHSFTGSHRYVLDYLVEEVLQHQPDSIRTFLLHTSILDRLCVPLCNTVTGRDDGREMLDILERSNLFLIPLDDQREWYRYHKLFSDVLQAYLLRDQPDQAASLHKRASIWYEQKELAPDAIRHALAAKDFERAAALVERAVPDMRRTRRGTTILELGWLKALPEELIHLRPVLSVDLAYALVGSGELEAVEARLQEAERWLERADGRPAQPECLAAGMVVADEEEFRRLPGMIALLRGALALGRGDMPTTVANARRALVLADRDDHLMLGGASSQLGLAAWAMGDLETAYQMTFESMAPLRVAGYTSAALGCALTLADIQIVQGRLREAMATYEQALQWATKTGTPIQRGAADMHVGMSELLYEYNDLKTATQHLQISQDLGELAGMPQNPYRWCAAMAHIRQAQGDLNGALELLDEAGRVYNGNFSPNVRPLAARKVPIWIAQGRLDKAQNWIREQGLSLENDTDYMQEYNHMILGRVLLACYRRDPASASISDVLGFLERLLKAAEEGGRVGSRIEILIVQALACHAQGNHEVALIKLQQALGLAKPEGYVRRFLDEGLGMRELLQEASTHKIDPDYTCKLLAAFNVKKLENEEKPDLPPAQSLIEPLSQRELKILALIAQGLSNREIGERLFLALDTIKGYNRNLFDKLQVHSRTEAIARARELGLL